MTLLEKEWYIEAPWGRLSIIAWGDCCDPPVLVCHGSNDTCISFRPMLERLPQKFYYIGLDLPGNGKSDPMPPGLMISMYDLVYSLQVVVKHFRWDKFVYVGHSMGCILGKLYHLSYPGKISKTVDIDPVPFYLAVTTDKFPQWFKYSFIDYFENYENFNSKVKPKITREEALLKIINRRGINRDIAERMLERMVEPCGDGLVRFTYDERYQRLTYPPFSAEHLKSLFLSIKIPTLTIIADESKKAGKYSSSSFLLEESPSWPHYRFREVGGGHDCHITHPEIVAPYLAQLLLHGINGLDNKAKL